MDNSKKFGNILSNQIDTISDLVKLFNENKIDYDVLYTPNLNDQTAEGIRITSIFSRYFPFYCNRINWNNIHPKQQHQVDMTNPTHIKRRLKEIISKFPQQEHINVIFEWAYAPNIRMKLEDAIKYIDKIYILDWDTWIFHEQDKWCIEIYHEGEITFGYSPYKNLNNTDQDIEKSALIKPPPIMENKKI